MRLLDWLIVLFVGLKLTGYIDWSWWFVLSPIWIPFLIIIFSAFAIGVNVSSTNKKKRFF